MESCKVSEIDYAKGLIKVEFPAKDNLVSSWITFPAHEYEMPEVGDLVKVEFEPDAYGNPYTSGICYQKCFNKDELPKMQGKDIFYKTMKGDLLSVNGQTSISGETSIDGNLSVSGVVSAQNI